MSSLFRCSYLGSWFCVGLFRELGGRVVLEALPVSMLWLCHADEAGGIFSRVYGDGGGDPVKCGIACGTWDLAEGFESQPPEALASGAESSSDGDIAISFPVYIFLPSGYFSVITNTFICALKTETIAAFISLCGGSNIVTKPEKIKSFSTSSIE